MTKILPFSAIRPVRDKAHLVATMPYYTYKKNVLVAKLEHNPYTFLHVLNPEFNQAQKTPPNSVERFNKIRQKFDEFVQDGVFVHDSKPCLYLYKQTKDGHEYLGLIAGASVDQYNTGHIKKHEATITSREEIFALYLDTVKFHAEPVLLFHERHENLSALLNAITKHRPEYEYTSAERIKHEVWIIENQEAIALIQKYYREIPDVYIADGHHRCASSATYTHQLGNHAKETQQHFLAYFISEDLMFIQDYNRIVRDLGDNTQASFIHKIEQNFVVQKTDEATCKPHKLHEIAMYFSSAWYKLTPKSDTFDYTDSVNSLDTAILTNLLLEPVLGISDLKTDKRIDFISGNKGMSALQEAVDSGQFQVAFGLFPVTVSQLKQVADEGKIMPPKSTWIEPKLRSGLTIYPLD
ncbi:MAG: DUF1015 domain-containing protein [Crocinitomicaceae bacterium]|nr:DUF1015 domain-containing protein [Crocinitomicaceae bacterium]MBK8924913.1 DUF1015 domain-containing protein [Crocinitomicaceae bacterium]